jgi:glycerate kinase
LFARQTGLAERMGAAQLIITAEGALDRSTVMGKGVGEVARLSRQLQIPCLGLAGMVEDPAELHSLFTAVHALVPDLTGAEEAKSRPGIYLEQLARRVAEQWQDPA